MANRLWSAAAALALAAALEGSASAQPAPPQPGSDGAPRQQQQRQQQPRGPAPPPVQWTRPTGPSAAARPSAQQRQQQRPGPDAPLPPDPTAVVPALRPQLDPAASGAAGPMRQPLISVRGRVAAPSGRAAAILDVDGRMIGVETGSRFTASGMTVEVEDVSAQGVTLRFVEQDRVVSY